MRDFFFQGIVTDLNWAAWLEAAGHRRRFATWSRAARWRWRCSALPPDIRDAADQLTNPAFWTNFFV